MRQVDVTLDAAQAAAADRGIKAMMPIGPGGRPFLDFILSALADAGYTDVCLVVGPDHRAMRDHYAQVSRLGITFAVQAEPRGTADALLAAEPFASGEDVLVMNGCVRYFGSTSRSTMACWPSSCGAAVIPVTRPISTPLNVTFDPGSTTRPARGDSTLSRSRDVKVPRNCMAINAATPAMTTRNTAPATLYGGAWRSIDGGFCDIFQAQ